MLNNSSHMTNSEIRKTILSYKWELWLKRPLAAFMISLFNESITRRVMKKSGINTEYAVSVFQSGAWYESQAVRDKFVKDIKRYLNNGGTIFKVTRLCEVAWKNGQKAIKQMVKRPNLNIDRKLVIFKNILAEMNAYVWLTYGFEDIYHEKLNELVPKYIKNDTAGFIKEISIPSKANAHSVLEKHLRTNTDLSWIRNHFAWIKSRDGFSPGFTLQELADARKKWKQHSFNQEEIVVIPKELKKVVKEVQELIYFRTLRGDARSSLIYLMRPVLKEVAKRHNITFRELRTCSIYDLSKGIVKKYKPSATFVLRKGNMIFFSKPIIEDRKIEKGNIIKGVSAFGGLVKGVARIVTNSYDLEKIKTNDIFVAQQTFPAFIMGMRKAKAFITDEGGITCHAAIIAREMKKPCIIATKNATRILKDGDFLEVDANQGIVKILKRNISK